MSASPAQRTSVCGLRPPLQPSFASSSSNKEPIFRPGVGLTERHQNPDTLHENPDTLHAIDLLRTSGNWPSCDRTAQECNELTSLMAAPRSLGSCAIVPILTSALKV